MDPVWILLLFGVGLLLLLIELLVPSAGLLFAMSLGCMAWSIYGSFEHGTVYGIVHLAVAIGASLTAGWWALNRLSHTETQPTSEGFYASGESLPQLLDQVGKALTPLRPGGTAKIGPERIDVVTRGEFIEPETAVKVIEVEGNRVVVRAIRPEDGRSKKSQPAL